VYFYAELDAVLADVDARTGEQPSYALARPCAERSPIRPASVFLRAVTPFHSTQAARSAHVSSDIHELRKRKLLSLAGRASFTSPHTIGWAG